MIQQQICHQQQPQQIVIKIKITLYSTTIIDNKQNNITHKSKLKLINTSTTLNFRVHSNNFHIFKTDDANDLCSNSSPSDIIIIDEDKTNLFQQMDHDTNVHNQKQTKKYSLSKILIETFVFDIIKINNTHDRQIKMEDFFSFILFLCLILFLYGFCSWFFM